ncbi:MAG: outer membrane lipoprotein carrier protein LolA [Sinobacteraceae bacterium]|nr:outer membrane lipoprotein carrier protein LolA [Nevskiaceae bacterium]
MIGAPASATAADATASGPAAQARPDVVRGTFTQRKYLAELGQPLVSSGRFVVAADHGLLWQIEQPVQAQLVITENHLVQRSDGHEIARIDADQQPTLRVVAALLLAVFRADMAQLRQYFDIQKHSRDSGHWTMTLRPIAAAVGEFIDRVRIQGQGAAQIERIEIDQPGGDRSVIELHTASAGAATLGAQEKARFRR